MVQRGPGALADARAAARGAPDLPTLDEALAFFVDEAPDIGLHVDLKLRVRLDELAAAIVRHGLEDRTVVSGVHIADLLAVGRAAPRVRLGHHVPGGQALDLPQALSLADRVARADLDAGVGADARAATRTLAGASAVMLQHRLVTASAVERSHAAGLPVLGLDGRRAADFDRVVAAGVDGVITNDPTIFVGTLEE